jgi:alpha-tubulin suppressor-like RCC1 family protein
MVLLLLLAACSDKSNDGDSACPSGKTLEGGECVEAADDSGTQGDDTGTPPEVHARWITAGTSHSCLLLDGVVTCWGGNDGGELDVPDGRAFRTIDAADHTCGLTAGKDAEGVCWGPEEYSENFVIGDDYVEITTGNDHGCGISINGLAVCWGSNIEDQSNAPDGAMIAVDAGAFHTCGLHANGRIECWGRSKVRPEKSLSFTSVSAGGSAACGITSTGGIHCWGEDKDVISGFPSGAFEQVSVGGSHACALDAGGAVQCWGDNGDGQTGVPGGTYEQVSAGANHTCAITTAGDVACWGSNDHGQADPP